MGLADGWSIDPGWDFDRLEPRRDGRSWKWNQHPANVLPMWVADMDFPPPPASRRAVAESAAAGWWPYGLRPTGLIQAAGAWWRQRLGWQVDPAAVTVLPGAVMGVVLAVRALAAGRPTVVLTPVYPPLRRSGPLAGTTTREVPWTTRPDGSFALDLDALATACQGAGVLVLCHPHNPIGRGLSGSELAAIADLVRRLDLWVVSDELWGDLVLDGNHVPLAVAHPDLAPRLVTVAGPTKTFNLAGLGLSFLVAGDPHLRARLRPVLDGVVPEANVIATAAADAAYREGGPWLDALCAYLRGNRDACLAATRRWPGVRSSRPVAGYLWWLDLRDTALAERPAQRLRDEAGLALSDGADFGLAGCVRLNFACPRQRLMDGLERLGRLLGPAS